MYIRNEQMNIDVGGIIMLYFEKCNQKIVSTKLHYLLEEKVEQ